jgi:hypothetical protein
MERMKGRKVVVVAKLLETFSLLSLGLIVVKD